jgi:hypothetical protein
MSSKLVTFAILQPLRQTLDLFVRLFQPLRIAYLWRYKRGKRNQDGNQDEKQEGHHLNAVFIVDIKGPKPQPRRRDEGPQNKCV